jgi:FkbM family methyltransferase
MKYMLIKLSEICNKYQIKPKGVLHVGACRMEELEDYKSQGISTVIWVEGNPNLVKENEDKAKQEGHVLVQGLIYDEDDLLVDFNLTNNIQSSSILKFGKHSSYHPSVVVTESIKLKTLTLKTLFDLHSLDPSSVDFINLDIQGVELKALKSFGEYLDNIKYIYTEINSGNVYEGNDLVDDIDKFLSDMGFDRVETRMTEYEWGDALYIKK